MTNRLIRITTALAVVAVRRRRRDHLLSARRRTGHVARRERSYRAVAAVHGGRPHLGGVDGGTRREPPEPPCAAPCGMEPGRRHAELTWTGFAPPQPYNLEVDFATATP